MQQEFLTPKELEILQLVANILTNCQIAEKLKLSPRTVDNHLYRIYRKLEVKNLVGALIVVINKGLIIPDGLTFPNAAEIE